MLKKLFERAGGSNTIVFVGHSRLFAQMFRDHGNEDFHASEFGLAMESAFMANCSIIRATLVRPSDSPDAVPRVSSAEFLFGTGVQGNSTFASCNTLGSVR